MICFEVYVNGEKLCRAGKDDLSVMTCILSWVSPDISDEELSLSVGGLYAHASGVNVHPNWLERLNLNPGDEIKVKIVDAEHADKPVDETVETPESIQQQKRRSYEMLKAEFEMDD